jgi:hypothetical protein
MTNSENNQLIFQQIEEHEKRIKKLRESLDGGLKACAAEIYATEEFKKYKHLLEYNIETTLNLNCIYKIKGKISFKNILDADDTLSPECEIINNAELDYAFWYDLIREVGIAPNASSTFYMSVQEMKDLSPSFAESYQELMSVKNVLLSVIKNIANKHKIDYLDIFQYLDQINYWMGKEKLNDLLASSERS